MEKVILITGGSRGLGAELVRIMSENRNNIVCFTFNTSADTLSPASECSNVFALKCDQRDEAQVKACAAEILQKYGRLDILINNACSAFQPCDFFSAGWDRFQELIDTNVKGTYHHICKASEMMKKQKAGRIINILTSYVLNVPPEKLSFYITAKYALLGLTRAAAIELAKYGITVNAVSPGMMATDLSGYLPKKYLEAYSARHPMKRMATTSDVAGVVDFLSSDAAGFLNGVNIPVNGGETF